MSIHNTEGRDKGRKEMEMSSENARAEPMGYETVHDDSYIKIRIGTRKNYIQGLRWLCTCDSALFLDSECQILVPGPQNESQPTKHLSESLKVTVRIQ